MTARWLAIARKDFDDAVRSLTLLLLTAIYSFLVALVVATPGLLVEDFPAETATSFVTIPTALVVPILALVASSLAIAGERESGTIKLLLGLPPTRQAVVAGKFVGRTAVVLTSIVVAFALGAVLLAVVYGTVPVAGYGLTVALTGLLAVSFVGIAVGLSAASRSRGRAMAGAVGLYLLIVVLWDLLVGAVRVVEALTSLELSDAAITFLSVLSPMGAYNRLVESLVDPALETGAGLGQGSAAASAPEAFYLADGIVVAIMLAWAIVPVLLGYLTFDSADLA